MRIAIITESFAPDLNGVANCVLHTAEHLVRRGHQPLVVAPEPGGNHPAGPFPYPVERVPSMSLPGYPGFRLGLPSRAVRIALARHGTDLVHLASPVFLGATGSTVARHLGLPAIAVYQTDIPAYARAYGWHGAGEAAAWRWLRRIHNAAERTLVPSSAVMTQLAAHGFERTVAVGARGRPGAFQPRPAERRAGRVRAQWAARDVRPGAAGGGGVGCAGGGARGRRREAPHDHVRGLGDSIALGIGDPAPGRPRAATAAGG
jgi:phosphatidylinositol alpha 1,6-mannosyltransferase